MDDNLIHLYVELCSDGTLLAYDSARSLKPLFSDFHGWNSLKTIYDCTQMTSEERKGKGEYNIKYVKYYFKNTQTGDVLEIPKEHIQGILYAIGKG